MYMYVYMYIYVYICISAYIKYCSRANSNKRNIGISADHLVLKTGIRSPSGPGFARSSQGHRSSASAPPITAPAL